MPDVSGSCERQSIHGRKSNRSSECLPKKTNGQIRRMGPIRPLVEDDIPQVADLNWEVLHGRDGPSPPELRSYLQELFFHNPWLDQALPSLVYENHKGKIVGFLGVVPRRMLVRGRPIQVAFGSNFVIHPDSRSTLAALHLVRAFLSGKQDLSMSDSANDLTRKLLTGVGFHTALLYNIYWSRPLRPSLYAMYAMSRLKTTALSQSLRYACRLSCSVVDLIAAKVARSSFGQGGPTISEEELDIDTLLACLSEFSSGRALRPEYDRYSLNWLLGFMGEMRARGQLRKVALRNKERKLIGWYVYYIRRGGIGEVVQIGANSYSRSIVLDHLFYDARRHGAIALHGRLEAQLEQDLSDKNCFFYRRGDWMLIHSHEPELLQIIQSGDAFLTRLEGEWCLGFGG